MTDLNALIESLETSAADLKIAREGYESAECNLARARATLSRAEMESRSACDAYRFALSARTRTATGKSGAEKP